MTRMFKKGDQVQCHLGTGVVVVGSFLNDIGEYITGVLFSSGRVLGDGHSLGGVLEGSDRNNGLFVENEDITLIEKRTKKQIDKELLIGD